MARKKSTKKSKKIRSSSILPKSEGALIKKINVAWGNFLTFLIAFIFSFVLLKFSTNELFINFFGVLSILTGFIAFAFLIVFLVLIVVRKSREPVKQKKLKKKKK
ncbi:MAG: hypothetical protein WDZ62_00135 [Candidatus Pacearchaeota archaeon]